MVSQNDAFDAEADCMRLCVDFANGVDARDYPRVVELFAPDGVLLTPAKAFRGHAGIADFLRARPLAMVTRHLCTNFRITDVTEMAHARVRPHMRIFHFAKVAHVDVLSKVSAWS